MLATSTSPRELKLTHDDLLEDMEHFEKELPTKRALAEDEIAAIRACFYVPTFEHVRDRAIFSKMARSCREGWIRKRSATSAATCACQARDEQSRASSPGRERQLATGGPHDLAAHPEALSCQALGSHLMRHSHGQGMARAGASIADIQDVLDHESDKIARHHAGRARKHAAAEPMTKNSGARRTDRFR